MSSFFHTQASDDFNKARSKARFNVILNILKPERHELLSFDDVKKLVKPKNQVYLGMKAVQIKNIVGSEGRYNDFNKAFLPRHEHLRKRWERVDRAHLKDIILPPIKLYKIGEVYFVRDGNHRVSVARQQRVGAIDAEVVELTSNIPVTPEMTMEDVKKELILYERKSFLETSELEGVIDLSQIHFTATGRYDEILRHIHGHKYYINMGQKEEISLKDAAISWFDNLYSPIIGAIEEEDLLGRFPGRTKADLYVWIVRHWDGLKRKYGENISVVDAVRDYSLRYGKNLWQQLKDFFRTLFNRNKSS